MPILQEPVEQIANYDFFTGRAVVSPSLENLPPEEQTYPGLPVTTEKIAQAAGLSPVRVNHALNGIFGGAYKTVASISDYVLNLFGANETDPSIIKLANEMQSLPTTSADKKVVTQEDFLKRLTASDRTAVKNYINRREQGFPVVGSIIQRFYPQRSGQLESRQYDLDQRVSDIPTYYRDTMTNGQKKGADITQWNNWKKQGAKLQEQYKLQTLGKSSAEADVYLSQNPNVDVAKLIWDGTTKTIHSVEAARLLKQTTTEYGIPLDVIPAFAKNDKGQESFPLDENLWEPYIGYYDLPGTSYLNMTQAQVDAGMLPDKYLADWNKYQAFKTDTARSAFKRTHKEISKSTWRDDFRRANLEFDKWLQDNKDMKPLPKKSGGTSTVAPSAPSAFSGGVSVPRQGTPSIPSFPKPRMSLGIGAPKAP